MKNFFCKCVAVYLMTYLAFGAAYIYAQDDDMWGDFDASAPIPDYEPAPAPAPAPQFGSDSESAFPGSFETDPLRDFTGPPDSHDFGAGVTEPVFEEYAAEPEPEPAEPDFGYGAFDIDESYSTTRSGVAQSSINFIRVVRPPRKGTSETQNAVIEGLQVSTDKGKDLEEMIVTCYFIFRDKPSSYFYDINRKEKKLIFEFVDARTGSSPIAALEQAPLKEIVIEETQIDANKDIKGLNPEWHDMIRITFQLEHIPVISVSDEANIISFKYKWTTNPARYKEYSESSRFPVVFWVSGGVLGAIGAGTLAYFLTRKEQPGGPKPLDRDFPNRPSLPSAGGASSPSSKRAAAAK